DLLAELACNVPHAQDAVVRLLEVVRLVEHQIAMARGELASRHRIAGVHQDGPPPAPGQWPARDALPPVVAAVIIEGRVLPPQAEDDLEPFLAAGIAVVMHVLLEPEHVELLLVPAADDVEAKAAAAEVIGRDDLLRREQRRKDRYMHGAKHGEALGGG